MRAFLVVGIRDDTPYEDPGAKEPVCLFARQEPALRYALALNDCRAKPRGSDGQRPLCEAHSNQCREYDSFEVETMEIK